MLLEYIEFFEAYGPAIFEAVYRSALPFSAEYCGFDLGPPIAVYDNRIICFELSNTEIEVGDIIIAKPANQSALYCEGPILELQVNGTAHTIMAIQEPTKLAIRVGFKAKQNQTFYHVKKLPNVHNGRIELRDNV